MSNRAAYQLAKLQPKIVRFDTGQGGVPDLTPEDVSAALGMGELRKDVELYLRLKYTGDKTVLHELDQCVLSHIRQLQKLDGWSLPWPDDEKRSLFFLMQLGRLAINEVIGENNCPSCTGRGKTLDYHVCKRCGGTGKSVSTPSECARWCRIDRKAWERRWQYRYYDVLSYVQHFEIVGVGHVLRYLGGTTN